MQGREEARPEKKDSEKQDSDKLYDNKVNATPNGRITITKYFTLYQ